MHVIIGEHIAILHIDLALKKTSIGQQADKAKEPKDTVIGIGFDSGEFAGLGILDDHLVHQLVTVYLIHHGVPHKVELGVLESLLLDGLGSPQLVPAVDNGNLPGELGQVHGFFYGSITAAYYIYFKILEECGIAGSAERNALTYKLALVLAANGPGEGAGSQNNGLGFINALGANQLFNIAAQIHALDLIRHTLCAKLGSLRGHTGDKAGAALPFQLLAGVIFDFIGDGDLAAILALLDDKGLQSGTTGIQTGSKARRACA